MNKQTRNGTTLAFAFFVTLATLVSAVQSGGNAHLIQVSGVSAITSVTIINIGIVIYIPYTHIWLAKDVPVTVKNRPNGLTLFIFLGS